MEEGQQQKQVEPKHIGVEETPKKRFNFWDFYFKNLNKLLIIPLVILFLALMQISAQYIATGEFIHKSVSLKGGITVTVPVYQKADIEALEAGLSAEFQEAGISVRSLARSGEHEAVIVEAGIDVNDRAKAASLIAAIGRGLNVEMTEGSFTVEGIGSSLGKSFFSETIRAMIIAFIFMAIVVLISFRVWFPSSAVVLAAFSDIVITIAVVNIIGMRISTAGIAAFLTLIGYSVDTDILLSTRVLKRKEGTFEEKVISSIGTGMTMTLTTIAAVFVGLLLTNSSVIREIMIILFIGLLVDIINTWVQNVALLKIYVERKNEHKG